MPRPKPSKEDLEERKSRAIELRAFMKNNKLTEVRFGELTGISRRTVQMMRAGKVTPTYTTLRLWEEFRDKYKRAKSVTLLMQ
jgi:transcriptional regulator with XRE-family HTH domain